MKNRSTLPGVSRSKAIQKQLDFVPMIRYESAGPVGMAEAVAQASRKMRFWDRAAPALTV